VEVLVRPRRFFTNGVAPGDQAPGLVFAVAVTLFYVGSRFALDPASVTTFGGQPYVSAAIVLAAAGLIIAPAVLHLTAALQTILLMVSVRDRAGVSETVQVLAYATAPCALAGLPVPGIRVACAAYGFVLLVVGTSIVHDVSVPRAALVVAVPAVVVFGYAFGGLFALETVTGLELVNTDPPVARSAGGPG
jgi:hypothetical protein